MTEAGWKRIIIGVIAGGAAILVVLALLSCSRDRPGGGAASGQEGDGREAFDAQSLDGDTDAAVGAVGENRSVGGDLKDDRPHGSRRVLSADPVRGETHPSGYRGPGFPEKPEVGLPALR